MHYHPQGVCVWAKRDVAIGRRGGGVMYYVVRSETKTQMSEKKKKKVDVDVVDVDVSWVSAWL